MMMMMMMMMNCFYAMVDLRKMFSLISSRNHCQRPSPPQISDKPRAGFETEQNLSSSLVEWSCAVVITTTPRCHCSPSTVLILCFAAWLSMLFFKWLPFPTTHYFGLKIFLFVPIFNHWFYALSEILIEDLKV